MKLFKRNAIIITVVMFVCVAVYLNWSYNRDYETQADITGSGSENNSANEVKEEKDEEIGLYYEGDTQGAVSEEAQENNQPEAVGNGMSDYFANARLTRQQARDSAINTLRQAVEIETVSQEAKEQTLGEITVMASYSLSEVEIEAMIKAKGFSECVVFLKDDSATIAVPAPQEGLTTSAVSRITDIILSETELSMEQIKIIEVK